MNNTRWLIILLLGLLQTRITADTTMPAYKYIWDFTKSNELTALNWPEKHNPLDPFWDIAVHDRVKLIFANSRIFDDYVDRVSFCKEGDRILYVKLFLEPESVEDAFQTTRVLATMWELPAKKIDSWHDDALSGTLSNYLIANHHSRPAVDLEIINTLDHQRPIALRLIIGWPKSIAATQPGQNLTTTRP
jgi:hypothetical protein